MFSVSWLASPEAGPVWSWASTIVDALVAIGAFGDSIALLIPPNWLPPAIQSPEVLHKIGRRATICLVLGLVMAVPINKMKDVVAEQETLAHSATLAKLECTQSQLSRRHFTKEQRAALVANLKPFSGMAANVWIFSGGRPEKIAFAVDLSSVLRDAGWQTHGVSTRMIPKPM